VTAIFAGDETSTGERRRQADLQTVAAASSVAASPIADLRVAAVAAPAAVLAGAAENAPAVASIASGWKYCMEPELSGADHSGELSGADHSGELSGADHSGGLYAADEDQDGQGWEEHVSEGGWNLQVMLR
jgi:hypothetical protein